MPNYENIEIGNLLFGHSRGEFPFPGRELVNSDEWNGLMDAVGCDSCYGTREYPHKESDPQHTNKRGGYEDDIICINPYWWGVENAPEANEPNFLYKPTGLEIRWYKYAFRDSYINQDLTADELKAVFAEATKRISAQS